MSYIIPIELYNILNANLFGLSRVDQNSTKQNTNRKTGSSGRTLNYSGVNRIQFDDNNDVTWDFIVSKIENLVILQLEKTHTSTMDLSSALILSANDIDFHSYKPAKNVKFMISGYINDVLYHAMFSVKINSDGIIEIRNIDDTKFKEGETITIYPTTFVYHSQIT